MQGINEIGPENLHSNKPNVEIVNTGYNSWEDIHLKMLSAK